MVSFERVFEVLDLPLEIDEQPDAITLPDAQGHIEFDKVTFSYDAVEAGLEEVERFRFFGGSSKVKRGKAAEGGEINVERKETGPALTDININIQPGQLVALVGPSGAGKTTLFQLLLRFYMLRDGRITLNGTDIAQMRLSDLRGLIGLVPQDPALFSLPIAENIAFGRPEASRAEIEAAAASAAAHDFITALDGGYDALVGEKGVRLSGGQRQRIAIARAILCNPALLLLDEATSALDSVSEAAIQEALSRLMIGRTSLVIAHRLSTVMDADKILVMSDGRLVATGTHDQLMAGSELYAELAARQLG